MTQVGEFYPFEEKQSVYSTAPVDWASSVRTKTYKKEQLEYIQDKINKIWNFVEDRESRLAWKRVSEVNGSRTTLRAKLKIAKKKYGTQHLCLKIYKYRYI